MLQSLDRWWIHALLCYGLACLVTPADPFSAVLYFCVLFPAWMFVRYLVRWVGRR